MSRRVLVAYATKHGSTADIAEAIGGAIRQAGITTEVRPAHEVHGLDGYDAVIAGSAVYMGRWQDDGLNFLKRFERELSARPLWLFSSGPTGGGKDLDAAVAQAKASPEEFPAPKEVERRAARMGARGHATFAGKIGDGMTGLLERWMPKGDWRDFEVIRDWAHGIALALNPEPVMAIGGK